MTTSPSGILELMEPSTSFNRAIISDILLWIALVILMGTGIWFFAFRLPERGREIITVHFHDANEITRGAIVRMMGTEIGFVEDIKLKQDHVDVIIKTNANGIRIPSGSTFTVQFTGLVGSKSIEIVPPDIPRPTIQGTPLYLVEEPIRLKDMQNYQIDILQDLQHGAENIADFFGKKKSVEELQLNIQEHHIRTIDSVVFIDEIQQKIASLNLELTASIVATTKTMDQFTGSIRNAVTTTQPARLNTNFHNTLGFFRRLNALLLAEGRTITNTSRIQERLSRLNFISTRLSTRMQNTQEYIASMPFVDFLEAFNQKQEHALAFIERANEFTSKDYLPDLRKMRTGIQTLNAQLQALDARAENLQRNNIIRKQQSNIQINESSLHQGATPDREAQQITSPSTLPPLTSSQVKSMPLESTKPQQKSMQPEKQKSNYFFGLSGCSSNR